MTSGGVSLKRRQGGKRVGECAAKHAQHADHTRRVGLERIGTHQHGDPGEANENAGELGRGQRLTRERARHQQREEWCRPVEHGGETADDSGLAVDDEGEGEHIVEQRQHDERPPRRETTRQRQVECADDGKQQDRGQARAGEHEGKGRDLVHGDGDEEERSAP